MCESSESSRLLILSRVSLVESIKQLTKGRLYISIRVSFILLISIHVAHHVTLLPYYVARPT
jgi:hypothetical protein